MGVELGKVLAKNILAQLEKPEDVKGHDSSVSAGLLLNELKGLICCFLDYRAYPLLSEKQEGIDTSH